MFLWPCILAVADMLHLTGSAIQVEVLEVMYRCAKPVGERAYHQHLNAQVGGSCALRCLHLLACHLPQSQQLRQ